MHPITRRQTIADALRRSALRLPASSSPIHGKRPTSPICITTPHAAEAMLSFCIGDSRSPSNRLPMSTFSSGLMKYPRLPTSNNGNRLCTISEPMSVNRLNFWL